MKKMKEILVKGMGEFEENGNKKKNKITLSGTE